MFDLSFGKLAILFALCLMVLGPEKLPKLAAQLGRFAGQARAMARHFRAQLEQEIAAEDLKKELRSAEDAINKIGTQAVAPVSAAVAEVTTAVTTEVSGMQAAADAAVKSLDVAGLDAQIDLGFDSRAAIDHGASIASSVPEEILPPHEPMLEHETTPTPRPAASDKTPTSV